MSSAGSVALVAVAVALAACKPSSPPPPPTSGAGLASCREALRRAPSLPAHERAAALLRGCPVCGQSFEPLFPAAAGHPDLVQVPALVRACQTGCTKRAIDHWRQLLDDTVPGSGVLRPWRALGDDCPDAMRTDAATVRYASAPWFALAVIGDHLTTAATTLPPSAQAELAAERAAIAIPLPPWTMASTGLVVPPGTARPGVPWRHVTVYDKSFLVGRLPIGRLDGASWHVEGAGPAYPGASTSGVLARDLAALGEPPAIPDRLDDVLVIAPRAAPAARAVDALRRLDLPASLAVAVPDASALWHGSVAAHALRFAPITGPRLRVDLVAARIAAVGADGAIRTTAALPAGATVRARWQAAIAVAAGHPIELCTAVPDDLAVDQLVELLDDAAAAGVTGIALAPAGARADVPDAGPFDAAALRAGLQP